MLGKISYVHFTHGQGNDDVKAFGGSSHLTSVEEAKAISEVLAYGGEFGERGISYTRYEENPKAVTDFTATEIANKRGRLELELVFKAPNADESGRKEYIVINDYFDDTDLISEIVAFIKGLPAGDWTPINEQVETVNTKFSARRA